MTLNPHILKKLSGPIIGFLVFILMYSSTGDLLLSKMAGIGGWMAVWWITEAVSLYFTALLPLSLFPLLGIMDMREVAPMYTNEIIFLFIGGFLIAFAIEKSNLHKRIAFGILSSIGHTLPRVLLGIMLSSFLLSMWISNIATTMMLLPAVLAIAVQLDALGIKKTATPLLLGLAYASSIGGTASLIGTAPNLIFAGFYHEQFPDAAPITFTKWLMFGLPVAIIFFIVAFFVLKWLFMPNQGKITIDLIECKEEYTKLGKLSLDEKSIIVLFSITVLLWFFRSDIVLDNFTIPGWSKLMPQPKYITDSAIAIFMASIMLVFPSKNEKTLITWKEVQKIPLGIIFLFGGGFALAKGISDSGLSHWIADNLSGLNVLTPILLILALAAFMTFFTELTSNTASTYLILPIIMAVAHGSGINPLLLMVPVVFSASFAFMLPVATPPNTVVFASEHIKISEMIKAGLILNIFGIIIITTMIYIIGGVIFL
jgi:solute carrier family 13 (sodium-dependent dicarboxylate transporter), member 2/3/5